MKVQMVKNINIEIIENRGQKDPKSILTFNA
jgi:hypothetical protein